MDFAFSEEQEMLRDSARAFLEDKSPMGRVRALMETETGYDPAVWSAIAQQGWQAMHIPEEYGGAGFSYLELVILMEEMGRMLLPAPFFSTVALGANLLLLAGSEEQKQVHLSAIAAGERIVALAATEPAGRWDADGVQMPAKPTNGGYELSGSKLFVVDGHVADLLIVAARMPEGGISLFLVEGGAPGVQRRRLETMDSTRKQAEIGFDRVQVGAEALLGQVGEGWGVLERAYDLAAVALAAEQVGGAQRCLEMAVEYAKVRTQFGRAIGSFQAVKHKCADMLVAVESAKSAAYHAAWLAAGGSDELAEAAPLAKAFCSDAYFDTAAENIQIHGGIGFTWEHDAHLYFKRAKSTQLLLGSPGYHRDLLADRLGI